MKTPTMFQAEIRSLRAFRWLMKTEPKGFGDNPRWATFRKLRDRLRPFRMPLQQRITLSIVALSGGSYKKMVDPEMQADIENSLNA